LVPFLGGGSIICRRRGAHKVARTSITVVSTPLSDPGAGAMIDQAATTDKEP
jgi:hypothetical protein